MVVPRDVDSGTINVERARPRYAHYRRMSDDDEWEGNAGMSDSRGSLDSKLLQDGVGADFEALEMVRPVGAIEEDGHDDVAPDGHIV